MKKIKDFFTNLNYSILGFTLFAGRLALLGATIGDAIALFAFAGLYGFNSYMKKLETHKYNEQFEADVKAEFKIAANKITAIESAMGAINLGSTFNRQPAKPVSNGSIQR